MNAVSDPSYHHNNAEAASSGFGSRPVQTYHHSISNEDMPSSTSTGRSVANEYRVNPCLIFFGILYVILLLAVIVTSPNPLYSLLFLTLAILPAVLIAFFMKRHLKDSAVPPGFLWTQFLLASLPVMIIVIFIELALAFIFFAVILSDNIEAAMQIIQDLNEDNADEISTSILRSVPLWKMVILMFAMAFFVAGLTEEAAKWLLARRYRRIDEFQENHENGRRVSARGVVAIAAAGALGFATIENISFVLGLSNVASKTAIPFRRIGLTLLRDAIAFPVHIGTTSYIALAAAHGTIFGDGPSVGFAFFVAVLFHGSFDAISLIVAVLVETSRIPGWSEALAVVMQVLLVIGLVILCRSRFKGLLERERMVDRDGTFSEV